MDSAKYVSRVGGLAVALGLGMAVATSIPGTALADASGSSSESPDSSSAGSTGPDSAPSSDSVGESGPEAPVGAGSDGSGGGSSSTAGEASASSGSVTASSGSTSTGTAAPGEVVSTGGAHTSETDVGQEADDGIEDDGGAQGDSAVDSSTGAGSSGVGGGGDSAAGGAGSDGDAAPVTEPEHDVLVPATPLAGESSSHSQDAVKAAEPPAAEPAPEAASLQPSEPVMMAAAVAEPTEGSSVDPAGGDSGSARATVLASPASSPVAVAALAAPVVNDRPAKALQSQPGTFIDVATNLLAAAVAPFAATDSAPAQPAAPSPSLWTVLAWVRREIEDTFANVSVSFSGIELVHRGSAQATSSGLGSLAIAWGANSHASADGWFSAAIAFGDDDTATVGGNFKSAWVLGDGSTATATGDGIFSGAQVFGDHGTATAGDGSVNLARVEGNDSTAQAGGGNLNLGWARGDGDVAGAAGTATAAVITGDSNDATAAGSFTQARVNGDHNSAAGSGTWTTAAISGDSNIADASGDHTTAEIHGDDNVGTADGDHAIAAITGDSNAALAATEGGSHSTVRIFGDGDAADVTGDHSNTLVRGSDSVASAFGHGAEAVVIGDRSSAGAGLGDPASLTYRNTAVVVGDDSSANAGRGDQNSATVQGDNSTATAGPGDGNTAKALGDNLNATASGDGNTVIVEPGASDNHAPVAGDPGPQTVDAQTGTVTGTLGFSDPDGDALSYVVSADPSSGTVSVDAAGNYTYVPNAGDRPAAGQPDGTDMFSVTASDGQASTPTVIGVPVSALPAPVNHAPVAGDPGPQTVDAQTGTVTGTLGFSDPDGDALSYVVSADPSSGTVSVDAAGNYTYVPNAGDRPAAGQPDGTDMFSVTASDGQASTPTVIGVPVSALPAPVNHAPVAGDPGPQTVDAQTGTVTGTLGFSDPDGDALSYVVSADPSSGTVSVDAAGNYTYVPNAGDRPAAGQPDGTDMFSVTASDGQASTPTVIGVPVSALPAPVNHAPVAGDPGPQTVDAQTGTVTGTLGFSDPDGDALSYVVSADPSSGTVSVDAAGNYTYVPNAGDRPAAGQPDGTDMFSVTASDGQASTPTVIGVPITALPASTPPVVLGVVDLNGNPAGHVWVGPDGAVYQVVETGSSAATFATSVYRIDPDNPGSPITVVDAATGSPGDELLFNGNGYAYQSTFDYDTQETHVLVIDLQNPGSVQDVAISGEGGIVVGPDGRAYQLATIHAGGGDATQLAVIDPQQPETPTIVNVGPSPVTPVLFDPQSGAAYLTVEGTYGAEAGIELDTLDVANSDTPLTAVVAMAGELSGDGPVFGSDGMIYLTSSTSDGAGGFITHVVAVDPQSPSDAARVDINGSPKGGVVVAPDGTVYQTVYTVSIGGDFTSIVETTDVVSIDPANTGNPDTIHVPGAPNGPVAVGPDGTIYALTAFTDYSDYPNSLTTVQRVVVVDPQDPQSPVTVELDGEPSHFAVGPAGKAYVLSTTDVDTNGDGVAETITHLVVIDPQDPGNPVRVDVTGTPQYSTSDLTVAADGTVYVTTYTVENANNIAHVAVIDPGNTTEPVTIIDDVAGEPIGGVVLGADGTGYQTTVVGGQALYDYTTHVAVIGPDTVV